MNMLSDKLFVTLCHFLTDKEKASILSFNRQLRRYSSQIFFTEQIRISKISRLHNLHNYNQFTNIIFDTYANVPPRNISHGTYKYGHVRAPRYPQNVTYTNDIDFFNDEKIIVNFREPLRKTKFIDINTIRCITYIGKIDMFDKKKAPPNVIAKFYIAHDDLHRFKKLVDTNQLNFGNYELLL